jgi:hypothetical protein
MKNARLASSKGGTLGFFKGCRICSLCCRPHAAIKRGYLFNKVKPFLRLSARRASHGGWFPKQRALRAPRFSRPLTFQAAR